jgi:glutathione reductase (NADPH)
MTEQQALQNGASFRVRRGEMTGWANHRRVGAQFGQYKMLVDDEDLIIGAHILSHGAGEMINLFALAMVGGLKASGLKEMMWAYPTLTSDTKYMV